jgi:hypothetical protein
MVEIHAVSMLPITTAPPLVTMPSIASSSASLSEA